MEVLPEENVTSHPQEAAVELATDLVAPPAAYVAGLVKAPALAD